MVAWTEKLRQSPYLLIFLFVQAFLDDFGNEVKDPCLVGVSLEFIHPFLEGERRNGGQLDPIIDRVNARVESKIALISILNLGEREEGLSEVHILVEYPCEGLCQVFNGSNSGVHVSVKLTEFNVIDVHFCFLLLDTFEPKVIGDE